MHVLLNYFVDLCLLRKAPQDVSASSVVFALSWLGNLVIGFFLVGNANTDPFQALTESFVDSGLMLGALWITLNLQQLGDRFIQSGIALLGSGALLGMLALPLVAAASRGPEEEGAVWASLILLALILWNIVVIGHIIRHSFNLSLRFGIAFAFGYTLVAYTMMLKLFGGA